MTQKQHKKHLVKVELSTIFLHITGDGDYNYEIFSDVGVILLQIAKNIVLFQCLPADGPTTEVVTGV